MLFTSKYKNDMVVYSTHAEVILCDKYGNEKARALIDLGDIEKVGKYRWYATEKGYVKSQNNLRLHRLVMNATEDYLVDHINRNPLDNRKSNLRMCTQAENSRNVGVSQANSTGFKGVYFEKLNNKYRARIKYNGKRISLGCYMNPVDAAIAYDKKAIELFGDFAYTNFPNNNYIVLDEVGVVTYEELIDIVADGELKLVTEPDDKNGDDFIV